MSPVVDAERGQAAGDLADRAAEVGVGDRVDRPGARIASPGVAVGGGERQLAERTELGGGGALGGVGHVHANPTSNARIACVRLYTA